MANVKLNELKQKLESYREDNNEDNAKDIEELNVSIRLVILIMIIELVFMVMAIYYVFYCHQELFTRVLLILGILFIPFFSPIFVIYSSINCSRRDAEGAEEEGEGAVEMVKVKTPSVAPRARRAKKL